MTAAQSGSVGTGYRRAASSPDPGFPSAVRQNDLDRTPNLMKEKLAVLRLIRPFARIAAGR
jgi:hypothetical protein